jgi:hypothetical protein
MGWLGWTEEALMRTDVNSIEMALRGRRDLLKSIFGGSDESAAANGKIPATPENFREMVKRHNSRYRTGRRRKPGS